LPQILFGRKETMDVVTETLNQVKESRENLESEKEKLLEKVEQKGLSDLTDDELRDGIIGAIESDEPVEGELDTFLNNMRS